MRSVFVGAIEGSLRALETMADAGHPPAAVVTIPPALASRHSDYVDLGDAGRRMGSEVILAANVNGPETLAAIRGFAPTHAFVIGWSQICGSAFLDIPSVGSVGFHPAPLPENRGRAVIPWTILQRRAMTGSTLFWLASGVDDGDILAQTAIAVATDETARTLYDKHLAALAAMLRKALPTLAAGEAPRRPQAHEDATFCARRRPEDGYIDWHRNAEDIWTLIRATTDPYPGAFTYRRRRKLVVWESALEETGRYHGLPGQIQRIDERGALVRAGDGNHVLLQRWTYEDGGVNADLKLHEKLGIGWASIARLTEEAP